MNFRNQFELLALHQHWNLSRSPYGYYLESHVEYAFIGFCMALGLDHKTLP